jgi:hypothetical protein
MFNIPDNLFCELVPGKNHPQISLGSLQIPKGFTSSDLTETLNSLLEAENQMTKSSYRFFVNGKLLQSDLASHMSKYSIHGEGKIQIVFEDGVHAPQIGKRIEFKDWVREIHFVGNSSDQYGIVGLFSGRMALLNNSFENIGLIEKSKHKKNPFNFYRII